MSVLLRQDGMGYFYGSHRCHRVDIKWTDAVGWMIFVDGEYTDREPTSLMRAERCAIAFIDEVLEARPQTD